MNYFSFNGVSNREMPVVLTEPIVIPVPQRRGESVVIPGRDGSAWIDEGAYDSIDITLPIWVYPGRERALQVARWLRGSGWLTDAEDALYGWEARVIGPYSLAALPGPGGYQGIVPMQLQPLRKLMTPHTQELTTSGQEIENPEEETALPVLTIYGSGECSVTVNEREFRFASLPQDGTVVNAETQEAYYGDTLCNDDMAGDFPLFQPGKNTVTWTGGITKISVSVRWRRL